MDADLKKIDEKIDVLTDVVIFMKDQMVTKNELKDELKSGLVELEERVNKRFDAVDGHFNRIEQKLDAQAEKYENLEARTTRLEAEVFLKS